MQIIINLTLTDSVNLLVHKVSSLSLLQIIIFFKKKGLIITKFSLQLIIILIDYKE